MELRVLKYFLAVAREGSFTKAANYLHMSQPTLSRQLRDLEFEVGKKLLVRGKYNITLTQEGMLLRNRADEILSLVNKTEAEFGVMGNEISGDVYIGGGESKAMGLVAEIIDELKQEHPKIRYHLYSGNAEDVTEKLDKGLLDLGILIQPVDISKYESISLPVKDTWGVIMRKDASLAKQTTIKRESLLGLPLICSRQMVGLKSAQDTEIGWFGDYYDKLNIVATYNLIFNAALLVEKGVGYALTIDNLVNKQEHSNLCFRPLEPKLEAGLDIVWKKYQIFSKATELFLAKVQEKFNN